MQSTIARLGGGAAALALALALVPCGAAAQAGLSSSFAGVHDLSNNGNNLNSCSQPGAGSSTSVATSNILNCGPVPGGSASAASSSSNSARTASALGTANQTGTDGQAYVQGHGFSTQYSRLTVTGTPSATDNLIFHFITTQSLTGDANANQGYGFWNLFVAGGTDNPVFAQQTGGSSLLTNGAVQTAQGFDFTMPLTPTSGVFQYNFTVDATAYVTGHATGSSSQTGSIWAMLSGIDAVDASGAFISSASFDQSGFGTINTAPSAGPLSTVPEPSSMALLGTGLVALIPTARRKLKR